MTVEEFEEKCMDVIEKIVAIDIKQNRQPPKGEPITASPSGRGGIPRTRCDGMAERAADSLY